ncbi:hypothetical protein QN367_03980 [Cryobacterium sp. RTS3]|uniref:hypothetical protein n=1 Tax=Cryobacterium sp. RTS3 TaxID=3048643 RepID=UPI002B2222BE|nr:hypothetical protein [Cryobacterium sp. RTS3]MEA9998250.1 hypothetical protein [Cryobacterium sp. RTS3]
MTINFGARGHDVTWASTPEELARGLADYGVHNVQLALGRSFPELSGADALNPGMGAYFRRTLAAHGVDIAVLGCYDNIIHPDAARRESILRKFESYLRNARHFGAPWSRPRPGVSKRRASRTPGRTSRTRRTGRPPW